MNCVATARLKKEISHVCQSRILRVRSTAIAANLASPRSPVVTPRTTTTKTMPRGPRARRRRPLCLPSVRAGPHRDARQQARLGRAGEGGVKEEKRERPDGPRPSRPSPRTGMAARATRPTFRNYGSAIVCRLTGPTAGPAPRPDRRRLGRQHERVRVVELREVLHVGERRDLVVGRARHVDHRRRVDRLVGAERVGVELHDAERRVGDQDVTRGRPSCTEPCRAAGCRRRGRQSSRP